jgi:subtilisin family serine protease
MRTLPLPKRVLPVILAVVIASSGLQSQQPTGAQVQSKTSGLIRALASPGDLADPVMPGPLSEVEKLLRDVGNQISRGDVLPRLDLFVQYDNGPAAATGRRVVITPGAVVSLTANDAVRAIDLLRPPSFQLEDMRPFNRNARLTHRVNEFNERYPGFDGGGRFAVVVDGGAVRATHREFQSTGGSRVRVITTASSDTHATHVAGTIIAVGIDDRAKGMAPAGSVISLDFSNDFDSLAALGTTEVAVTNHSYGPRSGWDRDPRYGWLWWGDRTLSEDEDATFGRYGARESTFDRLLTEPTRARWLSFVAAGNDRNDRPSVQPVSHLVYTIVNNRLEWQYSQRERPADGRANGVDTVSGLCLAKNVVCVGAIEDALKASPPFATTSFSGWGPADDGRVKPDLVANGQNLLSASDASDQAYLEMPGTSMASPTAAGIALLIGQTFDKHRGRAATGVDVKAVLIHSASEAGRPGPDAEFGWGVINALAAGDVVAHRTDHILETVDVSTGNVERWTLNGIGSDAAVRVTMVWSDPPGRANTGGVDDSSPALQNDLDIELVGPNGTRHFPYRLDVGAPLANAKRDGVNRVDNVEIIDAPGATGQWQLRIRAHRLSQGMSQKATIITSGLRR